jgi:hypothetical protein
MPYSSVFTNERLDILAIRPVYSTQYVDTSECWTTGQISSVIKNMNIKIPPVQTSGGMQLS